MIRLLTTLVRLAQEILCMLTYISQLLKDRIPVNPLPAEEQINQKMSKPDVCDTDGYAEEELCTVDEARAMMNVSRSTINRLRDADELRSLKKKGRVRLLKVDVENAKLWYCKAKGKL